MPLCWACEGGPVPDADRGCRPLCHSPGTSSTNNNLSSLSNCRRFGLAPKCFVLCNASIKAASRLMIGSGQAIRVAASGPMVVPASDCSIAPEKLLQPPCPLMLPSTSNLMNMPLSSGISSAPTKAGRQLIPVKDEPPPGACCCANCRPCSMTKASPARNNKKKPKPIIDFIVDTRFEACS